MVNAMEDRFIRDHEEDETKRPKKSPKSISTTKGAAPIAPAPGPAPSPPEPKWCPNCGIKVS